jgi:gamma-glutamyltranspeptidase/glutathione hydrolase
MVVAAHPLAAQAGLKILRDGGNAVDAAVGAAIALNAVEPFASGIGGGGFMVIYLAREKRATVINYREKAPAAATPLMFQDKGDEREAWRTVKGTATAVPGALAGWMYALDHYGSRKFESVVAEAVRLAEEGFPVSETFSSINKEEYEKLLQNAGEASCYLNNGLPYEPGDRFRNPDLASLLRTVAAGGAQEFYQGDTARKIVAAVRDKQGIMSLADLASYRVQETEPLRGTYKDFTLFTIPPPGSGGLHVVQLLNVLESWPVAKWGHNSPEYVHRFCEALRFVFADHDRYLGDPDFVPVPIASLVSKHRAREIVDAIRPDRLAESYPHGRFNERGQGSTSHLCAADKAGNLVALTQSINHFFGSGIVPEGTGLLLNNHMDDFSDDPASPNAPNSGRRPVSFMGPIVVIKEGKPFLALGSPGGTRIFSSLTQIIVNITEFGMGLDEAIEAPRFFTYSVEGKARPISVEMRIPEITRHNLEGRGHKITVRESYDKYFGGAQGIMILREKRRLLGGADSRRDGWGAGY